MMGTDTASTHEVTISRLGAYATGSKRGIQQGELCAQACRHQDGRQRRRQGEFGLKLELKKGRNHSATDFV